MGAQPVGQCLKALALTPFIEIARDDCWPLAHPFKLLGDVADLFTTIAAQQAQMNTDDTDGLVLHDDIDNDSSSRLEGWQVDAPDFVYYYFRTLKNSYAMPAQPHRVRCKVNHLKRSDPSMRRWNCRRARVATEIGFLQDKNIGVEGRYYLNGAMWPPPEIAAKPGTNIPTGQREFRQETILLPGCVIVPANIKDAMTPTRILIVDQG